jgi:hypothetical protein
MADSLLLCIVPYTQILLNTGHTGLPIYASIFLSIEQLDQTPWMAKGLRVLRLPCLHVRQLRHHFLPPLSSSPPVRPASLPPPKQSGKSTRPGVRKLGFGKAPTRVTKPTQKKRTRRMNHTKTQIDNIKQHSNNGMMNTSYETAAVRTANVTSR